MKISNQSRNPIPDLGVVNRSKFVNFYLNGKVDNPMQLYNGLEVINYDETVHHMNSNGIVALQTT
ncbi:hypothetical protein LEP1GSC132_3375 [Leptospira kirschneri str. 200803703]|uniref:hypothetical protein n=1 Tax=Leptospira kirschneri TaxID=29507 RepID=UPI00028A2AD0|nr:hypothetical protein [Leptospira kirschneri]EMK16719.1 hypothetical protein LEP1GSC042_2894 [Leptospira kirschneri serovar Bim str. PUO 1247]EMN03533.1 hypothetical protein LEP1GSC046_0691 [Leptospira kirschneri serovar Bim str. 1051]EMO67434.1 hypothetical protein LEP1GSC132_3375 [Leptospira kirschneri str. 200803703]KON79255.1 Uncharacterized protein NV38_0000073 [Leptospira kirschneri serovar Mozdok]KPZ78439.1 hypothetical protein APS47_00105 [Leptospira kirschneri serovar Mozdok]